MHTDSLAQVCRTSILERILGAFPGAEYGERTWIKSMGGWTTPKFPTAYGVWCEEYPQLAQLNLDPGFITHIHEFLQFVHDNDMPDGDHLDVRNAFKEHLGTRDVWRGMMLTNEQYREILEGGMQSKFTLAFSDTAADHHLLTHYEGRVLNDQFRRVVDNHFHRSSCSPLISVTTYEDLAIAVGRSCFSALEHPDKRQYLFRLRVPEIDLISYTDHGVQPPSMIGHVAREGIPCVTIRVDGQESIYPFDKHTESFVLFRIDASEILDVRVPEVKDTFWGARAR